MNLIESITAQLVTKDKTTYDASIKIVSKYHLLVEKLDTKCQDEMIFHHTVLDVNRMKFNLGASRIIKVKGTETYELYFLNNIYDLETLVSDMKYIDIVPHFQNLKLIWSKQKKIKQEFKDYVLRLNYELNCYKQVFDQFEQELCHEAHDAYERLQLAVIKSIEGIRFIEYFDKKLNELKELVKDFSKAEHENHGFFMRKQLRGVIRCSDFLERTNEKPRGYAGDSEMMHMIYEDGYRGRKIFEKLLYHHAMQTDTAQAVRNRIDLVSAFLYKVKQRAEAPKLRFMSVACGPALEMYELFRNEIDPCGYEIILLDQDRDALDEAKKVITEIEHEIGVQLDVTYMEASIRTVLNDRDIEKRLGKFNFIYSLGMFDYLTPLVGRAVINKLFSLLEPGGEILIGNFHERTNERWYMSYWMDWNLYYRNEKNFSDLLTADDCISKRIFTEDTNNQMFLNAEKEKELT